MPRTKNHINVVHNDKPVPRAYARAGAGRYMAHDHFAERAALLSAWTKFLAKNEAEALAVPFPPLASFATASDKPGFIGSGRSAYLQFLGVVFAEVALATRNPDNEEFAKTGLKRLPQLWLWNPRFMLAALEAMMTALEAVSVELKVVAFIRTHRTIRGIPIEAASIHQIQSALQADGIKASPGVVKAGRQEVARQDVGQVSSRAR